MLLVVLDGWGHSENTFYNAIYSARTPCWDKLWRRYPHLLLRTSGVEVGLPPGQMGNSEVGHLNIGAGRVVHQEFTRISRAIETGSFFSNPVLIAAIDKVIASDKALHLVGLLSNGGVHGHEDHLLALMRLAAERGARKLYLHAILDGRDTPPKCADASIRKAWVGMREIGIGCFASLIGRYYAMDRDQRWDRTASAYDLISQGKAEFRCGDPFIAIDMAYARGETDEFVRPTAIVSADSTPVMVQSGDVMIFANYRADRSRQLARAFTKTNFASFPRERVVVLSDFVSLTEYKANYEFPVAFLPERMDNVLGEHIAKLGLRQLRVAETEKYAHVTFFFNGGEEHPFNGEDRILVSSPKVARYDQAPEMSAIEITAAVVAALEKKEHDLIVCNYANADMIGHTGNYQEALKAVTTIDACLVKLLSCLMQHGGEMIITADHGNVEQMREFSQEKERAEIHTAHTNNPVPFVYVGRPVANILPGGVLSDVAPTLLMLMGLTVPEEMTGQTLLNLQNN